MCEYSVLQWLLLGKISQYSLLTMQHFLMIKTGIGIGFGPDCTFVCSVWNMHAHFPDYVVRVSGYSFIFLPQHLLRLPAP